MDKRIGAQYFTLRDYIKTLEDFDNTCLKVSQMGYKTVQISGTPLEAKEMKEILDKYNLKVVTTHKGFADFVNNLEMVIDYNKTLGCEVCGVGSMPPEYYNDSEGVTRFIKEANDVAEKLRKEGLYFGYHNHSFEFAKFDGKTIMERLIDETNPQNFYFIADIGLRMLCPKELYAAMGFPSDYIIDRDYLGNEYKRSAQVARCGNAVCPQLAKALVQANMPEYCVGIDINLMSQLLDRVAT